MAADAPFPAALVTYLERRETARADAVDATLASLTDRERALVKEAAVMGYVQGRRHLEGEAQPKDSQVLALVIDACHAFSDLYPTISGEPAQPAPDLTARIYDALATFNATACWDVLRLAQMRQYLAEHVAGSLADLADLAAPAAYAATRGEPGESQ